MKIHTYVILTLEVEWSSTTQLSLSLKKSKQPLKFKSFRAHLFLNTLPQGCNTLLKIEGPTFILHFSRKKIWGPWYILLLNQPKKVAYPNMKMGVWFILEISNLHQPAVIELLTSVIEWFRNSKSFPIFFLFSLPLSF